MSNPTGLSSHFPTQDNFQFSEQPVENPSGVISSEIILSRLFNPMLYEKKEDLEFFRDYAITHMRTTAGSIEFITMEDLGDFDHIQGVPIDQIGIDEWLKKEDLEPISYLSIIKENLEENIDAFVENPIKITLREGIQTFIQYFNHCMNKGLLDKKSGEIIILPETSIFFICTTLHFIKAEHEKTWESLILDFFKEKGLILNYRHFGQGVLILPNMSFITTKLVSAQRAQLISGGASATAE